MAVFVVQRHDATRLHFDLRLEIAGVLISWAAPKGPSLDPRTRRLAVLTEDHDLDHAGFEGRTPGTGSPGTVIVWDTGTVEHRTSSGGVPVPATQALSQGYLRFELHGHRLTGGFALTRTGLSRDGRSWLLVKLDDHGALPGSDIAATELGSVLTGRTNADLESQAALPASS